MKKFKWEILIFVLFILSRIPGMGHDNFTTDTWKWKSRSYDFGTGVFEMKFEKTLQKYHPGVTLMWIGTMGVKFYNLYYDLVYKTPPPDNNISVVFGLDFTQKLLLTIVISLALVSIYEALKNIFNYKVALLSVLFISLEPFYVSLTRVFHLEGLLSTFMLASTLWLYLYYLKNSNRYLLYSGIFAGLSILTKTTALYLLPFSFIFLLIVKLKENIHRTESGKFKFSHFLRIYLLPLSIWFFTLITTIFILWPALWVDLVGVFEAIYRGITVIGIEREHIQYYFGRLVENPGISFYPVVFLYKSSVWLLLGIIGCLWVLKKLNKQERNFIIYLIFYSVFYIVAISIPGKKLDRYIVPSIASLSIIPVFFYKVIWSTLDRFKKEKINPIKILFLLSYATLLIVTLVTMHPDYLSYYNPLFGGLRKGINVLEPKWLIGRGEIINYFSDIQNEGKFNKSTDSSIEEIIGTGEISSVLTVGFPEKYYTQIWPFFREIGAWAVIQDMTPQAKHAQYFVYPVWDDDSEKEVRFDIKYVTSISVRGIPIYSVYKRI